MHNRILIALICTAFGFIPAVAGPTVYGNVPYGTDPLQIMDIYVPPTAGMHPVVIMIHGGGWSGGEKEDLTAVSRQVSGFGFVVCNIDYRLATARTNHYPTAVDDCFSALTWIQQNITRYNGNGQHVSAFGTSAGASLALTMGNSGEIKAVVDFYGPNNFTDPEFLDDSLNGIPNTEVMQNYLGFTYAQNPSIYHSASPFYGLTSTTAPTVIFQGLDDVTVPPEQSVTLNTTLLGLSVTSTIYLEPGLGHGFLTSPGFNTSIVVQQSVNFLKANDH